ncbi:MAG: hypothetical protein M3N07_07585 [Pseudomonadota bacterium]|nr:hypothetical protein [Pseudomonadota bacterium]
MSFKSNVALFAAAAALPFSLAAAQPASDAGADGPRSANEAQTATGQSGEEARRDRRICRRIDTTGSRTGRQRVCLTAEEWRRVEQ